MQQRDLHISLPSCFAALILLKFAIAP